MDMQTEDEAGVSFALAVERKDAAVECHLSFARDHEKNVERLRSQNKAPLQAARGDPLRRIGWQVRTQIRELEHAARRRRAEAERCGKPEQIAPFFRQIAQARQMELLERARLEGDSVPGVGFGDDALEQATRSLTDTDLPFHEVAKRRSAAWSASTGAGVGGEPTNPMAAATSSAVSAVSGGAGAGAAGTEEAAKGKRSQASLVRQVEQDLLEDVGLALPEHVTVLPERCHCGAAMELNTRTHRLQCPRPECSQGRAFYDMTPQSLDQGTKRESSRPPTDQRPAAVMQKLALACLREQKKALPAGAVECLAQELVETGFVPREIRCMSFAVFSAVMHNMKNPNRKPVNRRAEHRKALEERRRRAQAAGQPDPMDDPDTQRSEKFRPKIADHYVNAPALYVAITGNRAIRMSERDYRKAEVMVQALLHAMSLVTADDDDGGMRNRALPKMWVLHRVLELLGRKDEAV